MPTTDTVVIGAGHAGLAVSRLLTEAGVDHVVLDRGRVAERWRTERWDSLHLLTPAWMTRLPHFQAAGTDPDAFIGSGAFVEHLERYAASFGAPVVTGARVREVVGTDAGYRVDTDDGTWRARHVVIATGPHGRPRIPAGLDPAARAPGQRLPQPRRPGARRRARRRCLVVGPADRRRAGPVGPRGHPRRRAAHPHAAPLPRPGRLLVAPGHRPPRPHHRHDARPAGRPPRAVAPARRHLRSAGRPRPGRPPAPRRPPRRAGHRGRPARAVELGDDLGRSVADADRRLRRLLGSFDDFARCLRWDRELLPPEPPRRVAVTPPARRIDLAAERIDDRRGRGRLRPRPLLPARAGARERRADPPGPRPDGGPGPVRRGPALPAPTRLRADRRRPARRPRRGRPPGPLAGRPPAPPAARVPQEVAR